jgi:hypothetical protein
LWLSTSVTKAPIIAAKFMEVRVALDLSAVFLDGLSTAIRHAKLRGRTALLRSRTRGQ